MNKLQSLIIFMKGSQRSENESDFLEHPHQFDLSAAVSMLLVVLLWMVVLTTINFFSQVVRMTRILFHREAISDGPEFV